MTSDGAPQIRFGKYLLIDRLGVGGMAEVWKAKSTGPEGFSRTVAIKRVLPQVAEDSAFLKMFFAEARLAARLHHDNIIQVYELGDIDGEHFIVMEYIDGYSLLELVRGLAEEGPLPPALGALVVRGVCRGLAHSHAHRDEESGLAAPILHRDVTPSNVLVSMTGAVKLVDFGIAKALGEMSDVRTQTGILKGKIGYLSPEQVDGRECDPRSDLFSAGIVLHEALTGRRLFRGETDAETLALVRRAAVPKPSESNPLVPPALDSICLRALAADPAQRFADGLEMAAALDEVSGANRWNEQTLARTIDRRFPSRSRASAAFIPRCDPTQTLVDPRLPFHKRTRREGIAARGWILPATVVGLLGVGGAALFVVERPRAASPARSVVVPSNPAPRAQSEITSLAPIPVEVEISIDSDPSDALVFLSGEGKARGSTPLVLRLPKERFPLSAVLKKEGWRPAERTLTELAAHLQVRLSRAPPAAAPRVRPGDGPRPKRPPKPSDPMQQEDLVEPRWP